MSQPPLTPFDDSLSARLLRQDPHANLVISFHGNAGHVAEGERPASLRALASLPPTSQDSHTHVLTFDYRGFGRSTGSPTEPGLILDGLAVLEAARTRLGVPAERTVLLATSLGTAVVAGALDALQNSTIAKPSDSQFAGVVLTGAFESLATLLPTYAIAGLVPILGPVAAYPRVANYLISSLVDHWHSGARWTRICSAAGKNNNKLALHVLHARNDLDIAWRHADAIYAACLAGLDAPAQSISADVQDRAGWQSGPRHSGLSGQWSRDFNKGNIKVKQTLLEHGGHNALIWHAPVMLAVWRQLARAGV